MSVAANDDPTVFGEDDHFGIGESDRSIAYRGDPKVTGRRHFRYHAHYRFPGPSVGSRCTHRVPPNPSKASHETTIEDVGGGAGPIALLVNDEDGDSRVVVDGDGDTWEFAINDEIAYSRWEVSQFPEWIEPMLTSIGIRAVRSSQEDV